jgi:hypothetical protein
MRFKINLATEPYESVRRFFLLWGIVLAAVALFTVALVYGAATGWRSARGLRGKIAIEQQTLDKLNRQEEADLAILNKPENRDIHERSIALNDLIRRKEFSWTRIFADMEKLMPARLHVVSIVPRVTPDNDIEIHLQVAGTSRDKAIELVQRMEKSPDFHRAQILSESTAENPQQSGDTVQFEISALYVPNSPAASAAKAAGDGGGR